MCSFSRRGQDHDLLSESDFELEQAHSAPSSLRRTSTNNEMEKEVSSDDEKEENTGKEEKRLLQRKAFYKSQGRAKSRRSEWSNSLVAREFQKWEKFCIKLKSDPLETLRSCEAETFKTYLEWRIKNSRIKKESVIKAYWRRILCSFIDVTGHSMDNGVEKDIRDWIPTFLTPTFKLNTSDKEKHAMYVSDMYALLLAHWTKCTKTRHGRFRVDMDTIILLAGATATRPQALIESSSAKGSNKSLWYEHITILRVRDQKNFNRTTTVALVNLVHIKNSGGRGKRKKFVFHLEDALAFCIVSRLIAHAIADDAFRRRYASPEEIFALEIPAYKESLKVRFKKDILTRPIFRDIVKTISGYTVSDTSALPYSKCRDYFVWLGRLAGFEQSLEFYQLRRASGRKINSILTTEERNQTMGHHGDTYQRFYLPDLIERDFQSIYFGTPSQDELIQHTARMGISRDERAPIGLTEEQKIDFKLELDRNPDVLELRAKREKYKQRLKSQGYNSVDSAKGTRLYDRYDEAKRKLHSLINVKRKRREQQAILDFHDTIDDFDIERQLTGSNEIGTPTRPAIEYECHERAIIADSLLQSPHELDDRQVMKLRMKFIHNLARYCVRQENIPRAEIQYHGVPRGGKYAMDLKRRASGTEIDTNPRPKRAREQTCLETLNTTKNQDHSSGENAKKGPSALTTFTDHICLLCIRVGRIRQFVKNESLGKHIDLHKAEGAFEQGFHCWDPCCSEWIEGEGHFKNHAALKHGVWHPVQRYH